MVKWLNLAKWLSVRLRTASFYKFESRCNDNERWCNIRTDQIGRQCVDALGM